MRMIGKCLLVLLSLLLCPKKAAEDKAIHVLISALQKTNCTLPEDVLKELRAFYDEKIKMESRKRIMKTLDWYGASDNIFSNAENITTLYGWDFGQRPIGRLDLRNNKLKTINERVTKFPIVSQIHLNDNQIESIDIRGIRMQCPGQGFIIDLSSNNITAQGLKENKVSLPPKLYYVKLDRNPIGAISDYEFPSSEHLYLSNCEITLLDNVVFNSRAVYLSGNPLKSMQNVTFNGIEDFYMMWCGITLDDVQKFDWKFISEKPARIWMQGNKSRRSKSRRFVVK